MSQYSRHCLVWFVCFSKDRYSNCIRIRLHDFTAHLHEWVKKTCVSETVTDDAHVSLLPPGNRYRSISAKVKAEAVQLLKY